MIIYLHGFGSCGKSPTIDKFKEYFGEDNVFAPTYTVHNFYTALDEIKFALLEADIFVKDNSEYSFNDKIPFEEIVWMGSSTGALYAEHLALLYGGKVCVVNPVTDKTDLLELVGENTNYCTGVKYHFTKDDYDTFWSADVDVWIRRLVLVEKDDPLLDHSKTKDLYEGHSWYVEYDGDSHRFTYWDDALPKLKEFINSFP